MKKVACILLYLCFVSQVFGTDIIVTKNNRKYNGRVIKITDQGFVVRTVEGGVFILPKENISKIFRENKEVLDFEEGTRYYLEVRRPFLPFVVLGVATGVYAVNKYQEYQDKRRLADDALAGIGEEGQDYTYLNDQSKKALAWCIVSGLFSAGSFYVAIRPMEVKIPIGRIKLSTTPGGVSLALHF